MKKKTPARSRKPRKSKTGTDPAPTAANAIPGSAIDPGKAPSSPADTTRHAQTVAQKGADSGQSAETAPEKSPAPPPSPGEPKDPRQPDKSAPDNPTAPSLHPSPEDEQAFRQVEEGYHADEHARQREPEPLPADTTEELAHNIFLREGIPAMSIVMITPELAPVAKVGGLADVIFGLSRELEIRGNHVDIILPKYDCMRYDHIWGLQPVYEDLWVPWYKGAIHCTVFFGMVHGRKCHFIEPHSSESFFDRGRFYGENDDIRRFGFFCRAVMEYLYKSGRNPDILHIHDWQTGLIPVLYYEMYHPLGMTHPRVCYTIHNFRHQGITGGFILDASGLHRREYFYHPDRLLDNTHYTALNLMKGGIVYSNFVNTVSPTYAGEVRDKGLAMGLDSTLRTHHQKFGGIVNGVDYDVWNPEVDDHIPVNYSRRTIDKKYDNKRILRERLLMADNEKPIIAYIGRLDPQKGLDLVRHAIFYAINNRAQFVLLGSSPEDSINQYFLQLKHHINDNEDSHLEIGFDEELSHLIYAGADMMIVPSRFEPCGLTQLISMRYGTIPVVRHCGGLADTVFDKDFSHKPLHERNGYVFHNDDYDGIESALFRAIACYYQFPDHFRHLMLNAMECDYSWNVPGQHYLNVYDYIRNK